MVLEAGTARATIDPGAGGRLASLVVGGTELLVRGDADANPMSWGSYPMVPWAGRVRRGRFHHGGADHDLEINLPPHAIHGVGYRSAWATTDENRISVELRGAGWPFGGTAEQEFHLDRSGLVCVLSVRASGEAMPAQVGWHPWFVKPQALTFRPARMYRRDADGMPDGTLVEVPDGPWDDCFVGVDGPIVLHYAGFDLEVSSTCDHWVVYDEPHHATCVEPQSGPPDGFTLAPHVLGPGEVLRHEMHLRWGA